MTTYTVAFYEIDRAYGGPEEGGWWFNTGQLKRIARTFKTERRAYEYCRRANHILSVMQRERRPVCSMAYEGGRYCAEVYDVPPPPYYPETRPHYE